MAPGENVKAKLKGIEEEDTSPGFVLCDLNNPVSVGKIFDAQVINVIILLRCTSYPYIVVVLNRRIIWNDLTIR